MSATDVPTAERAAGWKAITADLQADILFGRILPRERLVEDDLIARFRATRHAVRRALDELERQGLAVRRPNRGVTVADYSVRDVRDLYDIRYALEALAATRIPLPADPGFVADVRAIAARHRAASEAGDFMRLAALNNEFHDAVFARSGNAELAAAIRLYALRTQPIRSRGFANPDLRRRAVAEHFAVCDALEAGDRDTLVALTREHIRWPMEHYLSTVAPIDDLAGAA